MKHFFLSLSLIMLSYVCSAQLDYPVTPKIPTVNSYHDIEIIDDYQWLEVQENEEVYKWVKAQNKVSLNYLNKLQRTTSSLKDMRKYLYSEMGDYDKKLLESKDDIKLYFKTFVQTSTGSPSLYYKKGRSSDYDILVNSNYISGNDRISFKNWKLSNDNTHLAYQYNRNGSDWKEIGIVKIFKRHHYKETLKNTRSSDIYWLNNGFFYEKFPFDSIRGKIKKPEIRYHVVGTKQVDDKLIFKSRTENEFLDLFGTENEDLFIIKVEDKKKKAFSYFFIDPLSTNKNFRPLLLNTSYNLNIFDIKNKNLLSLASINKKRHLVSVPIDNPSVFNIISPTYEDAELIEIELMENHIVLVYKSIDNCILTMVDYEGNLIHELPTPNGLTIKNLDYSEEFKTFFFTMGSYTIPSVLYTLNLETFKFEMVEETGVNFDFQNYKFIQKKFVSHDGVEVPMMIVYKNELKKDGTTPFLLKTYGGYGTIETPSYNPGIVYFIENGGAFAYINIRGGGELGNDWWKAGKRLNKTNGINDFISAAEHLIEEGFTSPKKIAITGTSHGGLVTAAALTQRPDLFGSAVIDVGALDMIRFGNFTVGAASTNISEFGNVENEDDFKNLFSYSPYHQVNDTINYPSILLVTGDTDTRVPALHSFKFAARLQNNPSQNNPVLLWTKTKEGHSGPNSRSAYLDEFTYLYSFLFHELK